MVAKLKLKGIDGRAPSGTFPIFGSHNSLLPVI